MDRFIGIVKSINLLYNVDLKSNMDRFIVDTLSNTFKSTLFKIQYG